ncbi:MAG: cache domain-containing protein [bacterium]|nr:MAG: cache domain-containing protein [bacterium]
MARLKGISLRTKLSIGLTLVVLISGLTATTIGVYFINNGIIKQAQNKVRLDLNTAREIYNGHLREIQIVLEFSAIRPSISNSLAIGDMDLLQRTMTGIYKKYGLDFLNITDDSLRVVFRCADSGISRDSQKSNVIVAKAWETGIPVSSTYIMSQDKLRQEGQHLAERAMIQIVPTPRARPIDYTESASGMVIMSAVPLYNEADKPIGVLYGGVLLNRKYDIVDEIKNIVYRGEVHKGEPIGTSTIFQGDTRISTNVLTEKGERAIGTRVSSEVYEQVLVKGRKWIDRAFVVNNWYITAYEPILNAMGKAIGILYVGILEEPYNELRRGILWSFLGLTGLAIALALIISYLLSRSILKPIGQLLEGATRLTRGELEYRIKSYSSDEIGQVCRAFNAMGESLLDRDRKLWEQTQQQLSESEKLASVGRLAAGVAHEINNPLVGVLTFSKLLLEDDAIPPRAKEDLKVIADETLRCREIVKNLLDFARETTPEICLANINEVIEKVLGIIRNQSLFQNITIAERFNTDLPEVPVDPDQIQQVIMNLVLNAAEAMPDGGTLTISTNYGADRHFIKISVKDTGTGIAKEDIERIFDPFFTKKERGEGTGLGLAVSYGIIQKHRGSITVTSQIGEGSTFEVNLPIAREESST